MCFVCCAGCSHRLYERCFFFMLWRLVFLCDVCGVLCVLCELHNVLCIAPCFVWRSECTDVSNVAIFWCVV